MPELYGVPVTLYRRGLTDELQVDFLDKATDIVWQRRGIAIARGASPKEIEAAIAAECAALEVEANTPPPDAPVPVEVPLPSEVINHAFDSNGAVTRVDFDVIRPRPRA